MKTESRIQSEAYIWLHNSHPELRGLFFRVKNENDGVSASHILKLLIEFLKTRDFSIIKELISYCKNAGRISGARGKATGVVPGVSDMILLAPGFAACFEFKTETGRQSEAQKNWQRTIERAGYRYFIVRSLEEFKLIILTYVN